METKVNPGTGMDDGLERMVSALQQTGRFEVLRRFEPPAQYSPPERGCGRIDRGEINATVKSAFIGEEAQGESSARRH